ncbi:hypothetical protein BdWA1_002571 [Babesia duncani]|uniref:Uncharacterized protein n=1 Tax=Babesia duncani TaxID=323732 RepID=A0AAD9PKD9_9APIC|nr:hypothetical protein BdWA1_002571 [Babesia duncani]
MPPSKDRQGSSKQDPGEAFISYLNDRNSFLGTIELDVSVPPPPVDAKMLDYNVDKNIINYSLTALELNERLVPFYDFDQGISDKNLEAITFSGCGLENRSLLESLESELMNLESADGILRTLGDELKQSLQTPELSNFKNVMTAAKEGLSKNILNLLAAQSEMGTNVKKPLYFTTPRSAEAVNDKMDIEKSWVKMTLEQRIDYYIDCVKRTFVNTNDLVHPFNPNAKIHKCYKIVPNQRLFKNRYIQVGVDGLASTSLEQQTSLLSVDGILNVAKEEQAHCTVEYYKSYTPGIKLLPNEKYRLKYIRQYSYQKSTKVLGNDNYYLLTLPNEMYTSIQQKLMNPNRPLDNYRDAISGDRGNSKDQYIKILPIKGQKIVLNKAGVVTRPDIELEIISNEVLDL